MALVPPPGLPLFPPVQGSTCASLYKHLNWGCTSMSALTAQPLASLQECTVCQMWGIPLGQFCHHKAKGIMKVGVQPMLETVLLQIPPSIRKVLWVCTVNHHDSIVYVEHVLLHSLLLLLLNLIQCPYHGIIVAFVSKCLLHVH